MKTATMDHEQHSGKVSGTTRRAFVALLAAALSVAGFATQAWAATLLPTTTVNDPPVAPNVVTAFPARDFVSAEGYRADETYVVEVHHSAERGGGVVVSKPTPADENGLVEINHPGGGCWDVVTPNIVAGDVVKVIVAGSPDPARAGVTDQTTVADVTAGRPSNPAPGRIEIHGTAHTADGNQVPLDQIEARLVAPGKTFAKSDKRDVRAPGIRGATLAYDAADPTRYTATWTGLSDADVKLALSAESMGAWLGRDPAAGVEGTIYETGAGIAGGPQAPCAAPKEKLPPLPGRDAEAPSVPAGLTAAVSDLNTVTLNWEAATDNEGVTNYGVYRNGVPIFTVQNADASAPAPTTFVDRNVPPGHYAYTVDAADAIDNRSAESAPAEATAEARPAATVPVSNPPTHPFTIFPSRDMIDVEGLLPDQQARVEVVRDGKVISDSTGLIPDETGLVEINHVGAYCWAGTTPEVHANDGIRATVYNTDGSIAWVDEATTASVTAQKAALENGVVTVHGTAAGHNGKPLPVDQIEQRLVSSSKDPFGINGKRTIRADASGQADGTLSYDPIGPDNPVGIEWTATYKGLGEADLALAQRIESRIMWLGRDPLAGLELTIFEVGGADPPGPPGPDCVAPLEPIDVEAPSAPQVFAAPQVDLREVDLAWTASTDNGYVYGYRIFQDGKQLVTVGGDATTYTAKGVDPGAHAYAVEAFDSASATGTGATGAERVQAGLGKLYGNTSARSADASVTMPDVQAHGVPQNLRVTNPTRTVTNPDGTASEAATNNARLVFDPSTDDSGKVAKYRVYRDGVLLPNAIRTPNASGKMTYTDTRLAQGATYRYAVDAANNISAKTGEVPVTIALDTEKPVFVGEPVAKVSDIHGKDVVLTWQAATDNTGVTGNGVDSAAPTNPGRPAQSINAEPRVGTSTVPLKVGWAPSTTGTLTRYELQQSKAGGAFTDVPLPSLTATSGTLQLTPGSSYRYQVRACNNQNCTAYQPGTAFNLVAVQEGAAALSYGGTWTTQALADSFGGSVRHASVSGNKVLYKFTGTQVEWIGTKGPNRGRAEVWLDGRRVATVDLYSPTPSTRHVLFSREGLAANTTHQVEVSALGTRNASSTGSRVDVDGFAVIR